MMKRRILAIAAVILILAGTVWLALWQVEREPVYLGKRLSYWLSAQDYPHPTQPREADAEQAIHEIGTNAIPGLLRMIQATDSSLKLRLLALVGRQTIVPISHTPEEVLHARAAYGFRILGSRAAAAVPALLLAATNTNDDVRGQVFASLGAIRSDPTAVLPVLVKALEDPNIVNRTYAHNAIVVFNADARSLPVTTPSQAQAAREALKRIEPKTGERFATNATQEKQR